VLAGIKAFLAHKSATVLIVTTNQIRSHFMRHPRSQFFLVLKNAPAETINAKKNTAVVIKEIGNAIQAVNALDAKTWTQGCPPAGRSPPAQSK
jgi:hypothetical protein